MAVSQRYPLPTEDPLVTYTRNKFAKKTDPRAAAYGELTVKFSGITHGLAEEKRTELDGLLWDLSLRLVEGEKQ